MHSVPLGDLPPQPPRVCFGRKELVESIVGLAENLTPIALIGAGGIGKTSIALTVLHHDRIKKRFGDNRRFIRCDQFPASRAHFLAQLSKAIGAGIEHPEDLASLQRFLSPREMILFLDNAESILDPHGTEADEIRAVVEELSRFRNICLGITSRITTIPLHCKRLTIPTLSMESACDIFYSIYDTGQRSDIINDLIRQLDFHALSITLLAATASQNVWDHNRLAKEWDEHQVRALQADCNQSLATTIELSLASPTFCKLGPDARDLLGVIAFFPQGVNEDDLDRLFPTIPDRRNIFDKFCLLSLTSRSNGFTTMLAPIRNYLRPQDPKSSPLLCATKDHYFRRLSVEVDPSAPGFGEARWIVLEDVNAEHLLDVFMSIDPDSRQVWDVSGHFFEHLYWHKPRPTVLKEKVEGLSDDHSSKPQCLFELARLLEMIGNIAGRKQLLTRALKLERERGNDARIALTLERLAEANQRLGLHEEGIQQAEEAVGIYERLGDRTEQARCLNTLAWIFYRDEQLDAAEEVVIRAIASHLQEGQEFHLCQAYRLLGHIYRLKPVREKAIRHFQKALKIASALNWHNELHWIHYELAWLFCDEDEFDDAHDHIKKAKSHAVNNAYNLGCATEMHARIWYRQEKFDEARSEALHAIKIYEKIGTSKDIEDCRNLLGQIESAMKSRSTSRGSRSASELLK